MKKFDMVRICDERTVSTTSSSEGRRGVRGGQDGGRGGEYLSLAGASFLEGPFLGILDRTCGLKVRPGLGSLTHWVLNGVISS